MWQCDDTGLVCATVKDPGRWFGGGSETSLATRWVAFAMTMASAAAASVFSQGKWVLAAYILMVIIAAAVG